MRLLKTLLIFCLCFSFVGCGKIDNKTLVPTVNGNDIISAEKMLENENNKKALTNKIIFDEAKTMYANKDDVKIISSDSLYGDDTEGILIVEEVDINYPFEVIGTFNDAAIVIIDGMECCVPLEFLSDKLTKIDNKETQIINPNRKVSEDELLLITGISFPNLKNVQNIQYSIIEGEVPIAQVNFMIENTNICLRAQATEEFEPINISGLYYEWDKEYDTEVGYCVGKIYLKDDIGYISWIDVAPGIVYNLSMTKGANKELLKEYANQFFVPSQGEVDADSIEKVEFDTYTYLLETDSTDEVYVPHLTINEEDESFTFMFDYLSSYIPFGYYEMDDESIYCLTDDRLYGYAFDIIDENTLEFNAEDSSPFYLIGYSDEPGINQHLGEAIKDGSRFILLKE